jgi:hypothetical protein
MRACSKHSFSVVEMLQVANWCKPLGTNRDCAQADYSLLFGFRQRTCLLACPTIQDGPTADNCNFFSLLPSALKRSIGSLTRPLFKHLHRKSTTCPTLGRNEAPQCRHCQQGASLCESGPLLRDVDQMNAALGSTMTISDVWAFTHIRSIKNQAPKT